MADSDFLRRNKNQHSVKNAISKKMDSDIDVAVKKLVSNLQKKYPSLVFEHRKKLLLGEIIANLIEQYPQYAKSFSPVMKKSYIKPDGGFLYATDKNRSRKLILIAEVKHQGTNDKSRTYAFAAK